MTSISNHDQSFLGAYSGTKVLITGHTGFKGAWLCAWLDALGARVTGYALDPPTEPSVFELCGLAGKLDHHVADVRDPEALSDVVARSHPDVIFHMAAQALVRESYKNPSETFATNVMGTVNLLDAVRGAARPCTVIVVTSDKCYENTECPEGYSETDPLGGHDPYSASKGCAEIVTSAYRSSFFPPERFGDHGVALASVRAGNVIGGGDWAADRIVPDVIRSLAAGEQVRLRNPGAVRPWQHVLDPLAGYLWLGAKMLADGPGGLAGAWNFGPDSASAVSVAELTDRVVAAWGEGSWVDASEADAPKETTFLRLQWQKAREQLAWRPALGLDAAVETTVDWYKASAAGSDMSESTRGQIDDFVRRAHEAGIEWAG